MSVFYLLFFLLFTFFVLLSLLLLLLVFVCSFHCFNHHPSHYHHHHQPLPSPSFSFLLSLSSPSPLASLTLRVTKVTHCYLGEKGEKDNESVKSERGGEKEMVKKCPERKICYETGKWIKEKEREEKKTGNDRKKFLWER